MGSRPFYAEAGERGFMLTVKVSIPGAAKDLSLSQFTGSDSNEALGCRFHVNDDCREADAWFVIDEPVPGDNECAVPKGALFFATAEAAHPVGYYSESPKRMAFLSQFDHIYTCHDVYRANVTRSAPFLPWMINANHGPSIFVHSDRDVEYLRRLTHVEKTRDLSVVCSTQTMTSEHRLRLRFVEKLKEHFGERIDWFGNGVNPVEQKWDALAPYRYSVVLENRAWPSVITEKLYDSFLALTYPLYWGAPNASDYFDPRAMTTIDILDLKGSIETIEKTLLRTSYEDRVSDLVTAKDLVLDRYNFIHRMARIAVNASMDSKDRQRVNRVVFGPEQVRLNAKDTFRSLRSHVGRRAETLGKRMQRA